MAQSATPNTTRPSQTTTSKLWEVHSELDSLDESDVENMSDSELVRLRQAIKAVEDKTEAVRKNKADECIKNRVEPGEELLGLTHIESHRKYLEEDTMTVVMRAVSKGIDYSQFIEVNTSTLAEVEPDLAEIGQHDYSYLR